MPFTPFHIGPGGLLKVIYPGYFSLALFIWIQVLIDVEAFYFLVRGQYPEHRMLHSYAGVNLAIMAALIVGRPTCEFIVRKKIAWPAALSGAAVGGYSHVFFDSFMHADMRPLWPFSDANPMLGRVPVRALYWLCALSALAALFILARARLKRKSIQR